MDTDWRPKLAQIWQSTKYFFATTGSILASKIQPSTLSQTSIYNPRTQYCLLNPQALALYAAFWTSFEPQKKPLG